MTKLEKQLNNLTAGLSIATKRARDLKRGLRGGGSPRAGSSDPAVLAELKKLRKDVTAGGSQQLRRMGL